MVADRAGAPEAGHAPVLVPHQMAAMPC